MIAMPEAANAILALVLSAFFFVVFLTAPPSWSLGRVRVELINGFKELAGGLNDIVALRRYLPFSPWKRAPYNATPFFEAFDAVLNQCLHSEYVCVESTVTGEIIARLCPRCDKQLPADWTPHPMAGSSLSFANYMRQCRVLDAAHERSCAVCSDPAIIKETLR